MTPLARRPSLATELTRRLQDLILAGEWETGGRLPGQRALAARLGVSMAAVREALAALAAAGLVESRQGQGTFVRGIGESGASVDGWLGPTPGPEELQEYLEARRVLERYAVEQAARRATPEHRARLRALVAEMAGALDDPARYARADLALHMTVAEAAGNRVLLRMMKALQASLQRYLMQVNEEHRRRSSLPVALETHERLVAAICTGNAAAAAVELDAMMARGIRYWGEKTHQHLGE